MCLKGVIGVEGLGVQRHIGGLPQRDHRGLGFGVQGLAAYWGGSLYKGFIGVLWTYIGTYRRLRVSANSRFPAEVL